MKLVPVTPETFSTRRWKRSSGYAFAREMHNVPLALDEIGITAGQLPLAFLPTPAGRYALVAILALQPGANALVAPNGQWLSKYVPSALRGYPFALVPATPDGQQWALCFDEDSGLLTDTDDGLHFYDEGGKLAPELDGIVNFLKAALTGRLALQQSVDALAAQGCIEPWPLKVQSDDKVMDIQGIFRGSQSALDGLSEQAYLALRGNPTAVLFAQRISSNLIGIIDDAARLQAMLAKPRPAPAAPVKAPGTAGLAGLALSVEDGQFKFE